MNTTKKIGIIICDRYKTCAGGKCFRSVGTHEGGFSIYPKDMNLEIVGYTTCGGCPGGNIEYAPEEMIKNGAEVIHLATGFVVGYPPCPYIKDFVKVIERKFDTKVEIGTHPIPEKYLKIHHDLKTWDTPEWQEMLVNLLPDQATRLAYD